MAQTEEGPNVERDKAQTSALWSRLDTALKDASAAQEDDGQSVVEALNSLSDAAKALAEALGEPASGPDR